MRRRPLRPLQSVERPQNRQIEGVMINRPFGTVEGWA